MKKIWQQYRFLLFVAIPILTADQVTKYLVRTYLPVEGQRWEALEFLEPYARIIHVTNTGVAFGMFKNMGWLFAVLAFIVACVIIYYYPKVTGKDWLLRLALSMQFSGAVGNLIDRILIGKVTDFVSVGNFAVWNVADASITVGVGVMILSMIIQEYQEKKKSKMKDAPEKDNKSAS